MPIDHVGLLTNDIDKMSEFYLAALKPLGYKLFHSIENGAVRGYAAAGCGPDFWLASTKGQEDRVPKSAEVTEVLNKHHNGHVGKPTGPLHIAFHAKTRAQVRAFHKAALEAGGVCNGPPGPRPQYFITYYGAFVIDPEGHNIEAVCLRPGFWAQEWGWKVWTGLVAVAGAAAATLWYTMM